MQTRTDLYTPCPSQERRAEVLPATPIGRAPGESTTKCPVDDAEGDDSSLRQRHRSDNWGADDLGINRQDWAGGVKVMSSSPGGERSGSARGPRVVSRPRERTQVLLTPLAGPNILQAT